MAALRTTSLVSEGGQGIIKILKISSVATGDTVSFRNAVKGWQVVNRTTVDAVTATYNASTQLFTITVANTPDIDLWVIS